MINIEFALRDEKVNIYSMTKGLIDSKYTHQIFICKKKPLNENRVGPFLLDTKKSKSTFNMSIYGERYNEHIDKLDYSLEYVSYIDSYIKFNVTKEILESLCNTGFFNIWDPVAPFSYFEGHEFGYLLLLRVYKIKEKVPEYLLDKGRSGRNFYFRLTESFITSIEEPVLSDEKFEMMKLELINIFLKSKQSFEVINVISIV